MKIFVFSIFLSVLTFSCITENENNGLGGYIDDEDSNDEIELNQFTNNEIEYLTPPFDTSKIISDLNIVDYVNQLKLIDSDTTSGLKEDVDTIICNYIVYGCVCPNWKEIKFKDSIPKYSSDKSEYPLHQYYIEPANLELDISKNVPFGIYRPTVMFIGRKYKKPTKFGDMGEGSLVGEKFRYYYYEVILPYDVFGPKYKLTDTITNEVKTYISRFEILELQSVKN